jgi:PAS domain S-box-containing protein
LSPPPSDIPTVNPLSPMGQPAGQLEAIRPQGVLLLLKGPKLQIKQASGNTMALLGRSPKALRKMRLKDLFVSSQVAWIKHCYKRKLTEVPVLNLTLNHQLLNHQLSLRYVNGCLHRLGKQFILELWSQPASEIASNQQVERERLMTAIAHRIRESLDLREILHTAVNDVLALLQADRVLVYRVWPDGTGSAIAEATTPNQIKVLDIPFDEETFPEESRQRYLQGRVYALHDRDQSETPPCLVEFLKSLEVRAKLVLPIIQQDTLWGLLIAHQCTQPRQWQDWEIQLLQQLATQMAIAIQQSELYHQLQEELSERGRIERALRHSEALFRSLSESAPIGIFRTNEQGDWIYTNPRCQAIGGFTLDEARGEGWQRLIHPDDLEPFLQQWARMIATGPEPDNQEFTGEIRFNRPDGSTRFCRLRTAVVLSETDDLNGYVGTIEDITESRAIAQMKNEFISIVSHELRTPLTAIRGSLGLLANGIYDQKPQRGKRMLQIAATQSDRLVRLVNDILDLGRLESGRVALVKQRCDAGALMLQSVDALRANAEQNQITLSVFPLEVQVWAAPDSIIQTLTNLISNAIKFSEPNHTVWISATLNPEITLPAYGLFQVKDQGRGIPADKLESIFDRFQQVDVSDSRKKGGTGLGLAICRSIIQQHGGQIWAESTPGAGSSFYFTLPLASHEANPSY